MGSDPKVIGRLVVDREVAAEVEHAWAAVVGGESGGWRRRLDGQSRGRWRWLRRGRRRSSSPGWRHRGVLRRLVLRRLVLRRRRGRTAAARLAGARARSRRRDRRRRACAANIERHAAATESNRPKEHQSSTCPSSSAEILPRGWRSSSCTRGTLPPPRCLLLDRRPLRFFLRRPSQLSTTRRR